MKNKTNEKILILLISFALFVVAVIALYSKTWPIRRPVLAICIAGMLVIAIRQSVAAVRKNRKT